MDAYLDTKPDEFPQCRRVNNEFPLPEVGALGYLLDIFHEVGQIVADGGGQLRALNWQDLAGYISATQQNLEPWESKAIIDLSMSYLLEHLRAKNPAATVPYFRGFK